MYVVCSVEMQLHRRRKKERIQIIRNPVPKNSMFRTNLLQGKKLDQHSTEYAECIHTRICTRFLKSSPTLLPKSKPYVSIKRHTFSGEAYFDGVFISTYVSTYVHATAQYNARLLLASLALPGHLDISYS